MTKIEQLEQRGFRVRVRHFRNKRVTFETPAVHRGLAAVLASVDYAPTGGATVVTAVDKDGREFVAQADCSDKDIFCRRTGRELALDRLVAKIDAA